MAMVANRTTSSEKPRFRNAAGAADCRAGGDRNVASKHLAKASRDAAWRKRWHRGDVKRKRGSGSAARRAERRRATAADSSTGEAYSEAVGGYVTADEGSDEFWPWGFGSWNGVSAVYGGSAGPATVADAQTQTWEGNEGSQDVKGYAGQVSDEVAGDLLCLVDGTATQAAMADASVQCEGAVKQESGTQTQLAMRDASAQTLRKKTGRTDQASVRLQTEFSFDEEYWKLLKKQASLREDMEKKTATAMKDAKEEETLKVMRSLRTTMLILNDRRSEAVGWRDDPIFPWDHHEDFEARLASQAAHVKLVEDRVRELRAIEAQLSTGMERAREDALHPFSWEAETEGDACTAPKMFIWESVEEGFSAVDSSKDRREGAVPETKQKRWNEIVGEKREEVDAEWRVEGRFVNQSRQWTKRQHKALEDEAWYRADKEWKETTEARMRGKIAELESQVDEVRWRGEAQGSLGAISVTVAQKGSSGAKWSTQSNEEWQVEQERRWLAVKRIDFVNKIPQFDNASLVWDALQVAQQSKRVFSEEKVCDGVSRFDYSDPSAVHFEGSGIGEDGLQEWRLAWLRREMRGIIVRNTGEIVARGLHKFFNVGQLQESKMRELARLQTLEVLEKLDGQMIMGVVLGDAVEYWSRKGKTAVAITATRLARELPGQHDALVKCAHDKGATVVFEMIGSQSRIKSDEGMQPRLVLIAVRAHSSGEYWPHWQMQEMAVRHGVQVVRRLTTLEGIGLKAIVKQVSQWKAKEGVIVRLEGGVVLKVKSDWWFTAGYCKRFRDKAKEWKEQEDQRWTRMQRKMQTKRHRLAVVRPYGIEKPADVLSVMSTAEKVEAVYTGAKLSVIIVSFKCTKEKNEAQQAALELKWKVCDSYSNRTANKVGRRIAVFHRGK